jgi:hypothetical protein
LQVFDPISTLYAVKGYGAKRAASQEKSFYFDDSERPIVVNADMMGCLPAPELMSAMEKSKQAAS